MLLLAAANLQGVAGTDTIEGAHAAVTAALGPGIGIALGIGLLASGLASTSVGCYAGATVMQGLLHRQIPVLARRAITAIPALVLLAAGVDPTWALVVSQVVLSFGIPFALIPLLRLTNDRHVMGRAANGIGVRVLLTVVVAAVVILNGALVAETLITGEVLGWSIRPAPRSVTVKTTNDARLRQERANPRSIERWRSHGRAGESRVDRCGPAAADRRAEGRSGRALRLRRSPRGRPGHRHRCGSGADGCAGCLQRNPDPPGALLREQHGGDQAHVRHSRLPPPGYRQGHPARTRGDRRRTETGADGPGDRDPAAGGHRPVHLRGLPHHRQLPSLRGVPGLALLRQGALSGALPHWPSHRRISPLG